MKDDSTAATLVASELPLLIGHRGCCALAPENTLPSFKIAVEAGADLVELDYRHAQDGVPMVIHDQLLDRTTDARRKWKRRRIRVARKTADELQMLDAGSWSDANFAGTKIPTLLEALNFISGQNKVSLVEHKSGDPETLAKLLRKYHHLGNVIVISFNWKFLRELHALEPALVLGALGPPARLSNGRRPVHPRRRLSARLNDLVKTGASVAVWNRRVSKRDVRLAHERGLKVWIYTVNEKKLVRELLRRGVNAIITDDCSKMRRYL